LDDVFPVWRRLVVEYGISGKPTHDARLVAAMMASGIKYVLTFNIADFVRFAGIEVLHPGRL
jgi:predicted nucleic acid-binding protein